MDEMLRGLLFGRLRLGNRSFDFLEGLLAVCITIVAFLLRTPFKEGSLHFLYLLAEWYLAFGGAVLVFRFTASQKRALVTYGILLLLPTVAAEGALLGGDACVGALLFICALLFLQRKRGWLFTAATAALLASSAEYFGLLFACVVLWQRERLRLGQLLALLAAGGLRLIHAYRAWFAAGYTLTTFHWPNIYGIVGQEAIRGQRIDPIAAVGLCTALGVLVLAAYLSSLARRREEGGAALLRLFLFFGLAAGYFLPYMDQSFGYLPCVLAVLYLMLEPGQFLVPLLLQIVTFAGYQEYLNGESMMPMALFSAVQFLVIAFLGIRAFEEMGILRLWNRKN